MTLTCVSNVSTAMGSVSSSVAILQSNIEPEECHEKLGILVGRIRMELIIGELPLAQGLPQLHGIKDLYALLAHQLLHLCLSLLKLHRFRTIVEEGLCNAHKG